MDDSKVARIPGRFGVALSVSVVAHACLISLGGVQPQYLRAQAPGVIEVRIVPVTAAGVGHTEPAGELIESVPIASSDATPPATGETDARPSSRLQASQVEETRATNQRQQVDAPIPMVEEPPIATLQASPPSGSIYYADSEVDAMPVALDPILPQYPSGSAAARDGGKVMVRLQIDAEGVVKQVVVIESQPAGVFDESTQSALASVRFKPAQKNGQAVGCQTVVSISYAAIAPATSAR